MKGKYNTTSYIKNTHTLQRLKGLTPYFYSGLNDKQKRIWSKKFEDSKEFTVGKVDKVIVSLPKEMDQKITTCLSHDSVYYVIIYWK